MNETPQAWEVSLYCISIRPSSEDVKAKGLGDHQFIISSQDSQSDLPYTKSRCQYFIPNEICQERRERTGSVSLIYIHVRKFEKAVDYFITSVYPAKPLAEGLQ